LSLDCSPLDFVYFFRSISNGKSAVFITSPITKIFVILNFVPSFVSLDRALRAAEAAIFRGSREFWGINLGESQLISSFILLCFVVVVMLC